MTNDPHAARQLAQARQEIQTLLRQIAELSQQDLEVKDYFQQFLSATVSALAATGGAVWRSAEGGAIELLTQINLQTTEIAEGGEDEQRHQRCLASVLAKGGAHVIPPYSGDEHVGNPTRFLLILVPLRSDDAIEGVIEIFQRPGASIDVQQGYLKFLHTACDMAGDWMRRRKYRQLADEQGRWRSLDRICQSVHESLNSRETAFAIANEGRAFLGCDRVSVATLRGGQFYLTAISGQDTIDRRSNLVVLLQTLTRRVLKAGDPFWYGGSAETLPPQIETALQEYVDFAHSKTVGVIPLTRKPQPAGDEPDAQPAESEIIGALVVEQIEDNQNITTIRQRASEVAPHASRALANAHDYETLFLMPLWRLLGHSRVLTSARNLPKTLLAGGALLLFLLVCLLVPIRFDLEGPAELQPVARRNVFAGQQGVVSKVHVDTGDVVGVGDELLTLRNTELNVQIEDLEGRLSVATEQLLEYERQLLRRGTATPQEKARWGSELASLRKQIINYTTQLKLLHQRQKELTLRSPIAGEVITWDARRLLDNRPVTPGQVLLTIADTSGDWELLVHMPENNIGYITDYQQATTSDLEVTYILATNPGEKHVGTLRSIDLLAQPQETSGHIVRIAADIDEEDLDHPRPGATATAQVHCGRRSIAFVWLHDVVEFLQSKVFF